MIDLYFIKIFIVPLSQKLFCQVNGWKLIHIPYFNNQSIGIYIKWFKKEIKTTFENYAEYIHGVCLSLYNKNKYPDNQESKMIFKTMAEMHDEFSDD